MSTEMQQRSHTLVPTDGSRTITLRDIEPHSGSDDAAGGPSSADANETVGVLKLRGTQRRSRQRVAWDTNVIDNEGCGKKKSKICCIYHKPRRFDESSSESESSSASDSEAADGGERRYHVPHACRHNAFRGEGASVYQPQQSDGDSDVNAYERAPRRKD